MFDLLVVCIFQDNGSSPLYIASQKGHDMLVKMLLAAGANVNQTTAVRNGLNLFGTVSGHLLVGFCSLVWICVVSQALYTPLGVACSCGHEDIVMQLLAMGVTVTERHAETALDFGHSGLAELIRRRVCHCCSQCVWYTWYNFSRVSLRVN